MNQIDRYVYAVTRYLPEDIREDVSKELRGNIEDMLPKQPTEQEINQVLLEFGSPFKLANEYNPKKRYLIGPGYYDYYISILKMVVGICIAVFAGLSMVEWVVDLPIKINHVESVIKLTTSILAAGVEGALQAFFWVTLVFFMIERSGVEEGRMPFSKEHWKPEDLPKIPMNHKSKISRGETVFSIFMTVLFTTFLYFQPQLIAIYIKDDNGLMNATPLFNIDRLQTYMPIILGMAFLQLGVYIWQYMKGNWNLPLAIGNAFNNILFAIMVAVMLYDNSLFHEGFFSEVAKLLKTSTKVVLEWSERARWICMIIIIVICIGESVVSFVKTRDKIVLH